MTTVRSTSLLALLTLLAASGCRKTRDPGLDWGATVVMAVPDASVTKPDTWGNLDFLMFLPLATLDEHGESEGRLARSWEHSDDFKESTLHLRTDVRWNDGKPVTAPDVKFTVMMIPTS